MLNLSFHYCTEDTPHANKREGSGSSLTNATDFSPRRVPAHQSTLSPARVRSLKSSTGSPLSPKSSLLSKAVNGNCHQASRCGRKRRLLPAIPDTNKQNPVGASGILSSPSRLHMPCQLKGETEANKLNDQMQVDSEEASLVVSIQPLQATGPQTIMEAKTQDQYDNDTFKREDKHVFSQRLQEAIPENSNSQGKALPTGGDRQRIFRSELETSRSNDTSLEALLKQHNKKIAAARSQYDENGRKIRTAEPNFCPAPSHKLSSSSSLACKRSTSSLDKPVIAAKQKRRSCVAAVGNVQSELAKSKARLPSQTNKKVKETIKQTAKQKRRSCAAALQQSGQANNTEKELRDLIAQHNSRVNAKKS